VNAGIVRPARRPEGWRAPGPPPAAAPDATLGPRAGEDLCFLAGDWRIFQRVDGHRWSLDDLVTAWVASRASAQPRTICDLGCGIGTVLLFSAWRFPEARLVGVEAQAQSAALARRSIAWNDVGTRVEVRSGDLRDEQVFDADERFDLVTGTPPYFPSGTGVESSRPQCAPCRFEHRGGVEAYVEAMARLVAPGGRAVVCQGAVQATRVAPAVERYGLVIEAQLDVVPREGKPVLVWFTDSQNSPGCKSLSADLFSKNEFDVWAKDRFVRLRIDSNTRQRDPQMSLDEVATREATLREKVRTLEKRYKVSGHPTVLILSPGGEVIGRYTGYRAGQVDYFWGLLKQGDVVASKRYAGRGVEGEGEEEDPSPPTPRPASRRGGRGGEGPRKTLLNRRR